jgi:hypothetical protein
VLAGLRLAGLRLAPSAAGGGASVDPCAKLTHATCARITGAGPPCARLIHATCALATGGGSEWAREIQHTCALVATYGTLIPHFSAVPTVIDVSVTYAGVGSVPLVVTVAPVPLVVCTMACTSPPPVATRCAVAP